ncbi:hypothetical protein V1511DRAFT_487524 [Dipodascopsis uninucleata]
MGRPLYRSPSPVQEDTRVLKRIAPPFRVSRASTSRSSIGSLSSLNSTQRYIDPEYVDSVNDLIRDSSGSGSTTRNALFLGDRISAGRHDNLSNSTPESSSSLWRNQHSDNNVSGSETLSFNTSPQTEPSSSSTLLEMLRAQTRTNDIIPPREITAGPLSRRATFSRFVESVRDTSQVTDDQSALSLGRFPLQSSASADDSRRVSSPFSPTLISTFSHDRELNDESLDDAGRDVGTSDPQGYGRNFGSSTYAGDNEDFFGGENGVSFEPNLDSRLSASNDNQNAITPEDYNYARLMYSSMTRPSSSSLHSRPPVNIMDDEATRIDLSRRRLFRRRRLHPSVRRIPTESHGSNSTHSLLDRLNPSPPANSMGSIIRSINDTHTNSPGDRVLPSISSLSPLPIDGLGDRDRSPSPVSSLSSPHARVISTGLISADDLVGSNGCDISDENSPSNTISAADDDEVAGTTSTI